MAYYGQSQENYDYDEDQDEYMKQEDEWNRDEVLDPAWERQQRKVGVFTRACSVSRVADLDRARDSRAS